MDDFDDFDDLFEKEEKKTTIGWQSSIWGNYYLGFDLRYRKINGKKFF